MTNGELTDRQADELRASYTALRRLAAEAPSPGVRAATRAAVAELHAALDGEALLSEHYSHHWGEPEEADR